MREAAFPVGAARMISASGFSEKIQSRARRSSVVFPVPGPPETTASGAEATARTARFCSSLSGNGASASMISRIFSETEAGGSAASAEIFSAVSHSCL